LTFATTDLGCIKKFNKEYIYANEAKEADYGKLSRKEVSDVTRANISEGLRGKEVSNMTHANVIEMLRAGYKKRRDSTWEENFAEFEVSNRLPAVASKLYNWKSNQMRNDKGGLDERIRIENESGGGGTTLSDRKQELVDCIARKRILFYENTWVKKFAEFEASVKLPAVGTKVDDWRRSRLSKQNEKHNLESNILLVVRASMIHIGGKS
jgi:hypothetical protein